MATKLQIMTELAANRALEITDNSDNWMSFLQTASWNYKYKYQEQILIYSQKPNATACAPIDTWNSLGRYVNRGTKGIALLVEDANEFKLRYVFDVSDTNTRYERPIYIWKMKDAFKDSVLETLENSFGELTNKYDFAMALIETAKNAVEDNYADYLSSLMYVKKDSFLEEVDQFNVDATFKKLLHDSVSYMMLNRCNIDAEEYFDSSNFKEIVYFNTIETVGILGDATSDISEMTLKEIGETVKNLQKAEKNKICTFAEKQKDYYYEGRNKTEGSFENGSNLYNAGRLSDSGIRSAQTTEDWKVWNVTSNISKEIQKRDLRRNDDVGQVEQPLRGDRPSSINTNGIDNVTDGTATGCDRETQSNKSDEMGWNDEQYQASGRGNSSKPVDLQLDLLLSEEKQINKIDEAEVAKASAFLSPKDILSGFSQEDIDALLQHGSGVEHGKYRIYLWYHKNKSQAENAKFLKNEYGWGGAYPAVIDRDLDEGHDAKGIKVSRGNLTNPDAQILMPWTKVAKRIGELISSDRYLYSKEKEELSSYIEWENERSTRFEEEKLAQEILSHEPKALTNVTKEYRFSLGDTVYLGASEYEILSLNDKTVRLFDCSFPIINKVISRSEFDERIKENFLNDHLLHEVDSVIEESTPKYEVNDLDNSELQARESNEVLEELNESLSLNLIGENIKIDGREFIVAAVDAELNKVSLKDITFQNGVGFPIFRSESVEFVNDLLRIKEEQMISPPKQKMEKVQTYDLHPDISQSDRHSFRITNENLENDQTVFSPKQKFLCNIEAIKLLKQLESENKFATPEEQEILARYIGFGGLSDAFDGNKSSWANEYMQLKALLNEDEYSATRESTLTAFYTSPIIIKSMYQALENMGFETGNILEPSCGTGNFLGMLPNSMQNSKLYGIELDSITGRIAQQLYQKSNIAVQGFEKTNLPDSFFDVAIGNVPFGQFKVADKRYDKNNFLIHDYFFGKALDKVRPGGIIAFITSKGTMDKKNPTVRKYIAQRADLLGAIRLPNTAFKANAGTEVTSDIIFLQKRDRIIDVEPDWAHLNTNENGIKMNSYFVQNPEMIMGEMVMESTQYGLDSTCKPYENQDLQSMLNDAINNIHAEVLEYELDDLSTNEDLSIPADPIVRNFSFTIVDGKIYFRENSRMNPVEVSVTAENRIKGMLQIRDCVRTLIEYQIEDYSDDDIKSEQDKLNKLYNSFTKQYGLINSRANSLSFSDDSSYCLLCSLEVVDENGELLKKADIFTKRTIKQRTTITSVDTSSEALAVSLAEKAKVDMEYMCTLTGKIEQEIVEDLNGVIFLNPIHGYGDNTQEKYICADEYLSGNVREKLVIARQSAKLYPNDYTVNVQSLEAVQPVDLTASEISVRLGATWIPPEIIRHFIFELFSTPRYMQWDMKVHYANFTSEWNIEGKSHDRGNIKAYNTYGTNRINGYKIIEETLNLKDVRIYDYVEDSEGKKQQILNKKETTLAQGKQELIKTAFAEWIWSDPDRREKLCKIYNEKFNSQRPREYDGSHITFSGINPEIILRPHQVNAIAHIMYGGNTLLAHVVGAGKTFEMVAAAQESKRLGLCQKSLFVVPNHLTEQWASEYLQLYPSANILVATKKDFETKNRKKFCGRIATGDYDAIIIGHTQFEKIPMSIERQQRILQDQLNEVVEGIFELKHNRGDNFSVKQLEKTKKTIKLKLDKLNDQSRKDDVVTFEELGVDRLFVDEAHYYKNLFLYTKMRNVGGIAQTEAQKSSDLFMKCRYLDEITGGRGTIFATGTPISNSMVELYTMQRYLQHGTIAKNGLQHFDSWASTFGETVTAIELAPEGTGYRVKTRFAKFYNLPELMSMFKEVADIQTADMLNLPVPKANYHNVVLKPTEQQKEMVTSLSDRAEKVRNKMVDSSVDNMLLITNDGRKLALDQRLMNPLLPDDENNKASTCAENVFDIWGKTKEQHLTQMIFCDLSTPHYDGTFNVYDDIKQKLVAKGVPTNEIAFIHDANTEVQKKELFGKVRNGQVRVLIGSTMKMGSGTNVQQKLVALHHLDCAWRPSDLQQREGRIIRQGNENPEVDIFSYVTESTFDAYLYQLVENKQKFISQIMTSKSPVRSAEDIDETALSYAEIKALATGNPYIKEKMDLDIDVSRLKLLKSNHLSQKYALEDQIIKVLPQQIKASEQRIKGYESDIKHLEVNTKLNEDRFSPMIVDGITYTDKKEAGTTIIEVCKKMTTPDPILLGQYRGFDMELSFDTFAKKYKITLKNELRHTTALGADIHGNITRMDNILESFPSKLEVCKEILNNSKTQLDNAKIEVGKPFPKEDELKTKSARLDELNILLNIDHKDNEIVDGEPDECGVVEKYKNNEYER